MPIRTNTGRMVRFTRTPEEENVFQMEKKLKESASLLASTQKELEASKKQLDKQKQEISKLKKQIPDVEKMKSDIIEEIKKSLEDGETK